MGRLYFCRDVKAEKNVGPVDLFMTRRKRQPCGSLHFRFF